MMALRLMGAAHNGFLQFKADNVLGALVRGIAERNHVTASYGRCPCCTTIGLEVHVLHVPDACIAAS